MDNIESFNCFFSWHKHIYVGKVHIYHSPGLYYFSIYLDDKEKVFFVDDETDRWIENNEGATGLAKKVGEAIDRHYHPTLQQAPPINPDQSLFFQ